MAVKHTHQPEGCASREAKAGELVADSTLKKTQVTG